MLWRGRVGAMVLSLTLSRLLSLCLHEVRRQCWACSMEGWRDGGTKDPCSLFSPGLLQPTALSVSGLYLCQGPSFSFCLCPWAPCLGHRSPAIHPLSPHKVHYGSPVICGDREGH